MARDYAKNNNSRRSRNSSGSRRSSNNGRAGKSGSSWSGLLVGLVLGLVISGLAYLQITTQFINFDKLLSKSGSTATASNNQKEKVAKNSKSSKTNKVSKNDNTDSKQKLQAEPRFDFYTILPDQKVAVESSKAKTEEKEPEKVAAKPQSTTTAAATNTAASKSTDKITAPVIKSNSIGSSALAESALAATREKQLIVQVGVFNSYDYADSLKAQLALIGISSSVTMFEKDGSKLYRVYVGPFDNKEQAVALQHKLSQNHMPSALVKRIR